jgi:hypothetical protein
MCGAKRHVRFTPNSDIDCVFRHVCFGPIAYIAAGELSYCPREQTKTKHRSKYDRDSESCSTPQEGKRRTRFPKKVTAL